MVSGASAALIATAPAGGCTARHRIIALTARPTATATRIVGWPMSRVTATPIAAESALPTTVGHGWARGLLGAAKTSTVVAPNGAIRYNPRCRSTPDATSRQPRTPSPNVAPTPARIASRGDDATDDGPRLRRILPSSGRPIRADMTSSGDGERQRPHAIGVRQGSRTCPSPRECAARCSVSVHADRPMRWQK